MEQFSAPELYRDICLGVFYPLPTGVFIKEYVVLVSLSVCIYIIRTGGVDSMSGGADRPPKNTGQEYFSPPRI